MNSYLISLSLQVFPACSYLREIFIQSNVLNLYNLLFYCLSWGNSSSISFPLSLHHNELRGWNWRARSIYSWLDYKRTKEFARWDIRQGSLVNFIYFPAFPFHLLVAFKIWSLVLNTNTLVWFNIRFASYPCGAASFCCVSALTLAERRLSARGIWVLALRSLL